MVCSVLAKKSAFAGFEIFRNANLFFDQADRFDVAVLRLAKRVRYEPHILPICLPTKEASFEEGMVAMVAGEYLPTCPETASFFVGTLVLGLFVIWTFCHLDFLHLDFLCGPNKSYHLC